jgi:hypothetical protein
MRVIGQPFQVGEYWEHQSRVQSGGQFSSEFGKIDTFFMILFSK